MKYVCNQLCQSYYYQSSDGQCFRYDSDYSTSGQGQAASTPTGTGTNQFRCVCQCINAECKQTCQSKWKQDGQCMEERGCVCGRQNYNYRKLFSRMRFRYYYYPFAN